MIVDLLVRGICGLRPGVTGLSENIRVLSIVGRFLEHSRVFYLPATGSEELYLGSADLMPRNLDRRVEILFPIQDSRLVRYLRDHVLATYLADSAKARRLRADGTYEPVKPDPGTGTPGEPALADRGIVTRPCASRCDGRRASPQQGCQPAFRVQRVDKTSPLRSVRQRPADLCSLTIRRVNSELPTGLIREARRADPHAQRLSPRAARLEGPSTVPRVRDSRSQARVRRDGDDAATRAGRRDYPPAASRT